jgi:2-polyprenyl-6-hydroxyphenyl methylase/3-demethylubiquinone-9 3-methyltransferase
MNVNTAITVDRAEVDKFSQMAATWWDETGTSGPLHRLNPARMRYIKDQAERHFNPLPHGRGQGEGVAQRPESANTLTRPAADLSHEGEVNLKPFTGLALADIGCGGGIVCEPLARLGASVTGIDASLEAITVAQDHAREMGLAIDYRAATSDLLVSEGKQFDIVLALEVVEHVADVNAFIASLKALLKPNGLLILSTPNRTAKSFASVIVGAEYILRWLPRSTHDWRRFLKPSELARVLRAQGLAVGNLTGIVYDPIKREFALSERDFSVNYLMSATLQT